MPRAKLPDIDFKWTPQLAYTIGLLTTDGNLSKDGRHIAMRSKESIKLLSWLYYSPAVPCLIRKRKIAEKFI